MYSGQYRIKCTSIQKGWYNNMKQSVKKRADKKALFTTEAVSACTVFVWTSHLLSSIELLLIMPYSYLHICIYLRMVCALVCVWRGGSVHIWYCMLVYSCSRTYTYMALTSIESTTSDPLETFLSAHVHARTFDTLKSFSLTEVVQEKQTKHTGETLTS